MNKWKKTAFYVLACALFVLIGWFCQTTIIDKCAVGLVLNMIGVVVVFLFGFPQPDYNIGCVRGDEQGSVIDKATGKTEGDLEEENKVLKKWHKAWSILGLLYLFAGFGFQLWHQLTQTVK